MEEIFEVPTWDDVARMTDESRLRNELLARMFHEPTLRQWSNFWSGQTFAYVEDQLNVLGRSRRGARSELARWAEREDALVWSE